MAAGTSLKVARLVIGSWVLAGNSALMPTEPGMFDEALHALFEEPGCPPWVHDYLHFVEGQAGWKCLESEEILAAAQDAQLTEEPNPTYSKARIKISSSAAEVLLRKLGVNRDEGASLGAALQSAHAAAK